MVLADGLVAESQVTISVDYLYSVTTAELLAIVSYSGYNITGNEKKNLARKPFYIITTG